MVRLFFFLNIFLAFCCSIRAENFDLNFLNQNYEEGWASYQRGDHVDARNRWYKFIQTTKIFGNNEDPRYSQDTYLKFSKIDFELKNRNKIQELENPVFQQNRVESNKPSRRRKRNREKVKARNSLESSRLPLSIEEILRRANLLVSKGQYDDALGMIKIVLKMDKKNSTAVELERKLLEIIQ